MSEVLGETIDRLVNISVRNRMAFPGPGLALYNAARSQVWGPLTLVAAEKIREYVKAEDTIIIIPGFRVPTKRVGGIATEAIQEVDGITGAVSMARAAILGLKAKPLLLIEDDDLSKKILSETVYSVDMKIVTGKHLNKMKSGEFSTAVEGYTLDAEEAEAFAKNVIEEYNPRAIIAIEKSGRNHKKEYHNSQGINITKFIAKVEPLFDLARRNDILTIGIVDGGNEVGNGNIRDTVLKHIPNAQVCKCPCKGGVAAESEVDVLVRASTSNWGGYGISALLAYFARDLNVLQSADQEEAMIRACVDAGAPPPPQAEGLGKYCADGRPIPVQRAVISMLTSLVTRALIDRESN